jgi:hypothetical protein
MIGRSVAFLTLFRSERMGAWGAGSFENDEALDFVLEMKEEGLILAGAALQEILDNADEYLEAPACSADLAAAEVVAALRGRPAAELPADVAAWIAAHPGDPGDELVRTARHAVDAIAADSELAELWSESEDSEQWRSAVLDLQRRLQ